jgi:transposase-like protein
MNANEEGTVRRRRSLAEIEHLVSEYKQSGLSRKEFCAAHGLSMHTLDAWRRRIAGSRQEIVPVEIVEEGALRQGLKQAERMVPSGHFRVVLASGLRIEVESGFDASELRRLIAALNSVPLHNGLRQSA